ncbi:MAG: Holliday junction branch migration protein RuvA, partial [Alphaproteobacteria bacterium]|nr:Holliday junction branch migration protein RuvA [Alphaproteobacteria bacterium]
MFAHLKGTIEKNESDHLVIDVNGVGYFVFASRLTLSNIAIGDSVKLHIETLMRQEALQLFGFLSEEEISWFRLLLTVQGVGPKVALGIIGSLGLRDLSQAILHQDKAMVSRADGVGPKLAGRILLELKDKLKSMDFSEQNEGIMGVTSMTPAHTVGHFAVDDAISAL